MLAGLLPLGLALERTGGAQLVADFAAHLAGDLSPVLVLMIFYAAAMVLTEFISNNATVVVLLPVAAGAATTLGLNPHAFILTIMFAASTSFMTPVGYQTNTMIHGPGGYKFLDFFRAGVLLNLLLAVVTPLYIYFIWGCELGVQDTGCVECGVSSLGSLLSMQTFHPRDCTGLATASSIFRYKKYSSRLL